MTAPDGALNKARIAFIIQRYGDQITGGSESHCRQIAERLAQDYRVEVITTCATDHLNWDNVLASGESKLNGVTVRRFQTIEGRQPRRFHEIYDRIFQVSLSSEEEFQMLRYQGPYSPELVQYVRGHRDDYDAFIVFTYMYYTAVHTLPILKSKAVFVPTAHDEASLYLHLFDDVFQQTPHILFNTQEERNLLQRRFNLPGSVGRVVGLGIEEPDAGPADDAWEPLRRQLEGKQVLTFIGRVENGKGCEELLEFFLRFVREEKREDLLLLLLGKRTLPIDPHPQILSPGYVSEYVKFHALRMTDVAVAPSPFESLCMAALESWMHERPLLVNGNCPVLVGHCLRSNGGLWYMNYAEFRQSLGWLLKDAKMRAALGSQGRAYVRQNYRWEVVEQAYREVLGEVIGAYCNKALNSGLLTKSEISDFTGIPPAI